MRVKNEEKGEGLGEEEGEEIESGERRGAHRLYEQAFNRDLKSFHYCTSHHCLLHAVLHM
jgi:hypothetical protein